MGMEPQEWDPCPHGRDPTELPPDLLRTQQEDGHLRSGQTGLAGTKSDSPLIVDVWPPELRAINVCCLQAPLSGVILSQLPRWAKT